MPVPCARCSMPLPKWALLVGDIAHCTMCGSRNMVRAFPAALADASAAPAETALEGEAACFDHPAKRAVGACQQCGRFVCQLCAVEFDSRISCPSCVAKPRSSQSGNLVDARMLYDSWALTLPLGLLFFWPLTILSGPAVLALAISKWRQPISLVRRNRWRFAAGLTIALIEGGLWAWFILYVVAKGKSGV